MAVDLLEILKGMFTWLYGSSIEPEPIIYFFIITVVIGLLAITSKYIINWNKREEKEEWQITDLTTKIILSFMVGLFSYLVGATSYFLIRILLSILTPQVSNSYAINNVFILFISFLYPIYTLKRFKVDEDKGFENIKLFCIFSLFLSIFILLIGVGVYVLKLFSPNVGVVGVTTLGLIGILSIPLLLTLLYYARISEFSWQIFGKKLWFKDGCHKFLSFLKLARKWR